LRLRLARFVGPMDVIDTLERLQGNERPAVIVSATASEVSAIGANADTVAAPASSLAGTVGAAAGCLCHARSDTPSSSSIAYHGRPS
jgi:hypothetical protein